MTHLCCELNATNALPDMSVLFTYCLWRLYGYWIKILTSDTFHGMNVLCRFCVVALSLSLFLVRRCSSLEAPQFGFIYPQFCKSLPISGTVCYLDCKHGFKSNGGVNEIRCEKDGKWNKDKSSIMKCLGMSRSRRNII